VTGGLPIDPVLGTWQIRHGLSALERIGHEALTNLLVMPIFSFLR
jgi:hypothetical protein